MSFKDILETSRSVALLEKLYPDEAAHWKRLCRQFSKKFHVDLLIVQKMDPELVCTELFSDQLDEMELEENIDYLLDSIRSLQDPEYDVAKERAAREEMKQIIEEEKRRVESGETIHHSIGLDGMKKAAISQANASGEVLEEQPKGGSMDMNKFSHLQNESKES